MRTCIHTLLVVAVALLTASCHYHLGRRQALTRLYLDEISNSSTEASLSVRLRDAFQTEVARQPGLALAPSDDKADYSLDLQIADLGTSRLASSELRDSHDRDHDSDAYQAVLHRLTITVKATVTKHVPAGSEEPGPVEYTVTGQGDLPRMPDRETALKPALQQAAQDAVYHLLETLDLAD